MPLARTGRYDDDVLIHIKVSVAAGRTYLRKLMEMLLAAAGTTGRPWRSRSSSRRGAAHRPAHAAPRRPERG
eukprot:9495593-Pyramimonas_sp.AAC.1